MATNKRTWQRILAKGKKLKTPPCVFLLPPQPKPGDTRPRNAFGYLLGFGKAYAEFYRRQDEARARDKTAKDTLHQPGANHARSN
jgi:hypothetical protein